MCSMFWMQKKILQEMAVAMVKYNYYEAQFRIISYFDLLYPKLNPELHFLQNSYPASDFDVLVLVETGRISKTSTGHGVCLCLDCFYGDIYLIYMVSVELHFYNKWIIRVKLIYTVGPGRLVGGWG